MDCSYSTLIVLLLFGHCFLLCREIVGREDYLDSQEQVFKVLNHSPYQNVTDQGKEVVGDMLLSQKKEVVYVLLIIFRRKRFTRGPRT